MNRKIAWLAGLVLLIWPWSGMAQAQTKVRLILDRLEAQPGSQVTAALELSMAPGWHTYWRNPSEPGGPGARTKLMWKLPAGITAGELQWPVPGQLTEPAGTTHVYEGRVHLLVPLLIASNASAGEIEVNARVSWLECQHECVPGRAEVSARFKVGVTDTQSPDASAIAAAGKLLPAPLSESAKVIARWEDGEDAESRRILVEWTTEAKAADFYAYEGDNVELLAKSSPLPPTSGGAVRLHKTVNRSEKGWPDRLVGILVAEPNSPDRRGYEVNLPIRPAVVAPVETEPFSWATLLPMLGAALLGGLILNLMPCVLPVIALKVLGFVRQAGNHPKRVRQLGLVYGLGVLTSFLVLALVLLGVQAAGGDANWSTAFQSPVFRVIMCVLMVLVALNLFGVFEVTLSCGTMTSATQIISREGAQGAFFNGVLAAVLATPCTAPFLATAVAFAFTQPPLVLILVFLTVGAGLALPFVLLCWQPAWLKLMPKPGDWMVRFKTAMGFPIVGTAIWMFWFTAGRMGESGVLWFGLFLVLVAAAAWAWGEFGQRAQRPLAGGIAALVLLFGGYFGLLEGLLDWRTPLSQKKPKIEWQPWSRTAVAEAKTAGKPVLVDFTADNCANCKFNKARSLNIAPTIERLKAGGFVTLEGDFTDADPEIAAELKRFKRRGVPLVLVHSKDGSKPPREMPTIFSPEEIHAALDWAVQ
jgi:thiol:disulfide interchange protein DsbD